MAQNKPFHSIREDILISLASPPSWVLHRISDIPLQSQREQDIVHIAWPSRLSFASRWKPPGLHNSCILHACKPA